MPHVAFGVVDWGCVLLHLYGYDRVDKFEGWICHRHCFCAYHSGITFHLCFSQAAYPSSH